MFNSTKTLIVVLTALAVIVAASYYLYFSTDLPSTNAPLQAKAEDPSMIMVVNPDFIVPSVHRLGINISDITPEASQASSQRNLLDERLKTMNPSYLRHELDSHSNSKSDINSSLLDLLSLCFQMGANPWMALSHPFSEADLDSLGRTLSQHADSDIFSRIIIEFNDSALRMQDLAFTRISQAAGSQVNLSQLSPTFTHEHFIDSTLSDAAIAKSIFDKLLNNTQPIILFDPSLNNKYPSNNILTVTLLNQVLGGSLHQIHPRILQKGASAADTEKLTMAAFRSGTEWTAAVASSHSLPITLTLTFPNDGRQMPTSLKILQYTSTAEASKDSIEHKPLQIEDRKVSFNLPANSFVVLTQ
jgi:hypothetical protein